MTQDIGRASQPADRASAPHAARIEIFEDRPALERAAAQNVAMLAAEAIAARGRFAWGLVGGTLAPSIYAKVAELPIDWSRVELFWGDERAVPLDHADSNYALVKGPLLDRAVAGGAKLHPMHTGPVGSASATPSASTAAGSTTVAATATPTLAALEQAAQRYEAELLSVLGSEPSLDLLHVGMGPDGHLCSLFPGHRLLQERTRWVAALVDSPKPPPGRITLSLRTVLAARSVCFLAAGAEKAATLRDVLESPTSGLPAAIVTREARSATWLIDRAAAGQLRGAQENPRS